MNSTHAIKAQPRPRIQDIVQDDAGNRYVVIGNYNGELLLEDGFGDRYISDYASVTKVDQMINVFNLVEVTDLLGDSLPGIVVAWNGKGVAYVLMGNGTVVPVKRHRLSNPLKIEVTKDVKTARRVALRRIARQRGQ